jgi:hypothetical protein
MPLMSLSPEGNPAFETVVKVASALGFKLTIQPIVCAQLLIDLHSMQHFAANVSLELLQTTFAIYQWFATFYLKRMVRPRISTI